MDERLRKLQFKGEEKIYVRGAPPELGAWLEAISAETTVESSPACKQTYGFAIFFVKSCEDVATLAPSAAGKVEVDGVLWFAYPKKTSKKHRSDLSRDEGWKPLGDLGFEGVRQVALDEDWTALRFRRVELIKTMQREERRALSPKGRARAGGRG